MSTPILTCPVTPQQAYHPNPVPAIPEGWESASFAVPDVRLTADRKTGWLDWLGNIIHTSDDVPVLPRIIVRRKPEPHVWSDLGMGELNDCRICGRHADDPIHIKPPRWVVELRGSLLAEEGMECTAYVKFVRRVEPLTHEQIESAFNVARMAAPQERTLVAILRQLGVELES